MLSELFRVTHAGASVDETSGRNWALHTISVLSRTTAQLNIGIPEPFMKLEHILWLGPAIHRDLNGDFWKKWFWQSNRYALETYLPLIPQDQDTNDRLGKHTSHWAPLSNGQYTHYPDSDHHTCRCWHGPFAMPWSWVLNARWSELHNTQLSQSM
jgi:hypothetical protein